MMMAMVEAARNARSSSDRATSRLPWRRVAPDRNRLTTLPWNQPASMIETMIAAEAEPELQPRQVDRPR